MHAVFTLVVSDSPTLWEGSGHDDTYSAGQELYYCTCMMSLPVGPPLVKGHTIVMTLGGGEPGDEARFIRGCDNPSCACAIVRPHSRGSLFALGKILVASEDNAMLCVRQLHAFLLHL